MPPAPFTSLEGTEEQPLLKLGKNPRGFLTVWSQTVLPPSPTATLSSLSLSFPLCPRPSKDGLIYASTNNNPALTRYAGFTRYHSNHSFSIFTIEPRIYFWLIWALLRERTDFFFEWDYTQITGFFKLWSIIYYNINYIRSIKICIWWQLLLPAGVMPIYDFVSTLMYYLYAKEMQSFAKVGNRFD
jgi:hypothetical protein